jgi:hypothetical protein
MNSYTLNIADYKIRLESVTGSPSFMISERFSGYVCNYVDPDILIRVHQGKYKPGAGFTRVFHAPYVEEILNIPVKKSDDFWSIYSDENNLIIRIAYPPGKHLTESWLRFSLSDNIWDMYVETEADEIDPLDYPLDGLILYYLTVIKGDIFIHGSGVNINHKGFLFTGTSGKGKTTMARIWNEAGGRVIHDDRLIIRNINESYFMFNTPVYINETPGKSSLDKIFIICHGIKNDQRLLLGANALTNIMANCIQHNWSREIISRLTASLYKMNNSVLTYKLQFKPDKSIVDYIMSHE